MRAQIRLASIACLALALVSSNIRAQVQSFTVDDDGPADFASLAEAVTSVPGGSVLLVEAGEYGDVVVGRRLSLLGRLGGAPPVLRSLTVKGAPWFRAQHLRIGPLEGEEAQGLSCEQVPGRVLLDDLQVFGSLVAVDCADVVVSGSLFRGGEYPLFGGSGGFLERSHVQLVDCTFIGGDGALDPYDRDLSTRGGTGLWVFSSELLLAGTSVRGGDGQGVQKGLVFPHGGEGIHAKYSQVDLRGAREHAVAGGKVEGTSDNAYSVNAYQSDTALHGGVSLRTKAFNAKELIPPRPWLTVAGVPRPGGVQHLAFHGREGASGLVVVSSRRGHQPSPVVSTVPTFVDPDFVLAVVPVALLGNETPVRLSWEIPDSPGLVGRALTVQGFQGQAGSGFVGTNAVHLLIGFP